MSEDKIQFLVRHLLSMYTPDEEGKIRILLTEIDRLVDSIVNDYGVEK